MIDFLIFILALVLFTGSLWFAYMSCVLVSEKKARYKAGTHDYYDNPINRKCMGGEDETLENYSAQQKSTTFKTTTTGIFDKSKVKYCDGDNT